MSHSVYDLTEYVRARLGVLLMNYELSINVFDTGPPPLCLCMRVCVCVRMRVLARVFSPKSALR